MHRQFARNGQLCALIASLRCGCTDPVRMCRMWKRVKKCDESSNRVVLALLLLLLALLLFVSGLNKYFAWEWMQILNLITISHKPFIHHNTSQRLCNFDCLWAVFIPSIPLLVWSGSLSAICAPRILGQLELHVIYPVPSMNVMNVMNVTELSGIKWIKWHIFGSFTCLNGQVHPLHRFIA